jgi:outer membrane protein OmpA-like peptidoglycan-associated protein/tetratricopeptide (TPR) repeat protein
MKNYKNIYLLTAVLLFNLSTQAQNKNTKEADKLFDRLEYVQAAKAYLSLTEKGKADAYVYKQLADSYYEIFNSKEAVKWYAKAVESNPKAETYYRYAQMLKAEGQTELADKQMNQFANLQPNDARAISFKNNPAYLSQIKSQSKLYTVEKSSVSSDKSEFGAILTNQNEVYFASARNPVGKSHGMNEEPYLDIYKATYNADGSLSNAILVDEVNTKWHDGPASITSDGNTMYFASESFNADQFVKDSKKKLKYGQIYLYKATKNTAGKWSNTTALPFNDKSFSNRNPSISADGKMLFFSSNRPGGMGGEDIYMVSVDGDNYGTPVNLDNNVNTEGNESFPFISQDNKLFFSSEARQGLGGYDVFMYDLNKKGKATNLGAPVNTQKDDFSFSYNNKLKKGFFSSNRDGNDDIFSANAICFVATTIVAKDKETGLPISGAVVNFLDAKNKSLGTTETNSEGKVNYTAECDQAYSANVTSSGYENAIVKMDKTSGGTATLEAFLNPIKVVITEKEVILQPIFFEYNKSNITEQGASELDKLVQVMNQYPNMVIFAKSHTDSRGDDNYNLKLSERRAQATVQYVISKGINPERITGKGEGETQPKEICTECTEEQHALNRRSEFLIVKK